MKFIFVLLLPFQSFGQAESLTDELRSNQRHVPAGPMV